MVKRRGRQRVAKPLRGKSPAEIESYLGTPEGIARLGAVAVNGHLRALRRLRKALDLETPSATWADAHWNTGERLPTGWVRCRCCGRDTPPNSISSRGACDDCVCASHYDRKPEGYIALADIMWGSSPSGVAVRVAAIMGVRVDRRSKGGGW